MRIGLVDVDGHHFPNLALMRISAWHKSKGDTVEWWLGDLFHYDIYRIYTIRDLGLDPYVMVYDKPHAPKEIRRLQRWVNNKFIFYKTPRFEDYL